jgi:hypothetical protein
MISGRTFWPFFCTSRGGFEDRARLHLGNFWEGDPEPAAAMAEHRIELVQLVHRRAISSTGTFIFSPDRPAARAR